MPGLVALQAHPAVEDLGDLIGIGDAISSQPELFIGRFREGEGLVTGRIGEVEPGNGAVCAIERNRVLAVGVISIKTGDFRGAGVSGGIPIGIGVPVVVVATAVPPHVDISRHKLGMQTANPDPAQGARQGQSNYGQGL